MLKQFLYDVTYALYSISNRCEDPVNHPMLTALGVLYIRPDGNRDVDYKNYIYSGIEFEDLVAEVKGSMISEVVKVLDDEDEKHYIWECRIGGILAVVDRLQLGVDAVYGDSIKLYYMNLILEFNRDRAGGVVYLHKNDTYVHSMRRLDANGVLVGVW